MQVYELSAEWCWHFLVVYGHKLNAILYDVICIYSLNSIHSEK